MIYMPPSLDFSFAKKALTLEVVEIEIRSKDLFRHGRIPTYSCE